MAADAGCPDACSGERYWTVPHHLAGRSQRHLVGDAGDAEVGDLDAPVGRDQEVSGLDVAVHESGGVGCLQRRGRLGDDVERLVGGEGAVALDDRRQRFAGHEFHDQEGAPGLLAVVEDAGDAFVVDEGGVAGLGAEALEEAGVAHVFVFEDLDGDGPADDVVGGLPHLAHAADGDPRVQLVAAAEGHSLRRSHLPSTASMTFFAMGAAIVLPLPD